MQHEISERFTGFSNECVLPKKPGPPYVRLELRFNSKIRVAIGEGYKAEDGRASSTYADARNEGLGREPMNNVDCSKLSMHMPAK